jgi:hypothetical protein
MSFFLSLRSELQRSLLGTWLALPEVAAIDSACCCGERQQWMDTLYCQVYSYIHNSFRHVRRHPPSYDIPDSDLPELETFMRWIVLRSVRNTAFFVTQDLAASPKFAVYLRMHGMYITKVCFDMAGYDHTWQANPLREMCKHCPNVTEIALPAQFDREACDECIQAWPLLQEIGVSTSAEDVLPRVAVGFPHLTAIKVSGLYTTGEIEKSWYTFFQNVNPNLRHVACGSQISREAMIMMAARCHQLRSFGGRLLNLNDEVLALIAQGCPLLSDMELSDSRITRAGLAALAQACPLALLQLSILPCEHLLQCSALHTLHLLTNHEPEPALAAVGAYCPYLMEFIMLSYPADRGRNYDRAVTVLVKGCPLLRRILLNVRASDGVLSAIGQHCPHLTSLHFVSVDLCSASDTGLSNLAKSCPKLCQLDLRLRAPITEVGIDALATHCPSLRHVVASKSVVKLDHWRRNGCSGRVRGLVVLDFSEP